MPSSSICIVMVVDWVQRVEFQVSCFQYVPIAATFDL